MGLGVAMPTTVPDFLACMRKKKYPKKIADKIADNLTEKNRLKGEAPAHSYRCSFCLAWHVGHKFKNRPANNGVVDTVK